MRPRMGIVAVVVVVLCLICSGPAPAAPYTPTQADMLTMVNGFGAGSIQSITPSGPGVLFNATLGNEGTFSRFVPQKNSFNSDLSAFSSFDVFMTSMSAEISGTKLYIQTGAGFAFFENAFVSLPVGVPTLVSLDFAGIPDLNNVRQYGWQAFGGPGSFPGVMLKVDPVPEPAFCGALAAAALMLVRRRGS